MTRTPSIAAACAAAFGLAALAGCAEAPPPPSADGEIVAQAVRLAQERADQVRLGKTAAEPDRLASAK